MDISLRVFYGISVLLLNFQVIEPGTVKKTIKDVMKAELCDIIKQPFIESDSVKKCDKLNYPSAIERLDFQSDGSDIFLCLNAYDAFYKICHYIKEKQWTNTLNSKQEFDAMVQHLTSKENNNKIIFCNNLKGYSPVYNEIKPALLKLVYMLKQQDKCLRICFNFNDELDPLCAILAWIKSIDKEVEDKMSSAKNVDKTITGLSNLASGVQSVKKNNDQPNDVSVELNPDSNIKQKIINVEKNKTITTDVVNNSSYSPTINNTIKQTIVLKDDHNKSSSNLSSAKGNESDIKKNNTAKIVKVDFEVKKVETESEDNKSKRINVQNQVEVHPKNAPAKNENVNDVKVQSDNKSGAIFNPSDNEIGLSTLSEPTQDTVGHVKQNNADSEDYNHLEDDQPHSSNGDGLEQSPDIDNKNMVVPSEQRDMIPQLRTNNDDEESHFFTYFAVLFLACIAGYIGYHNKQKILAIVLEGRRTRSNRGRRRPSTANYRKLDCTLEEAITSQCNANVTHVIY